MNKSKFEELVNLYFDQEISDAELECLKKELATKSDRRSEFQFRHQLHRATCSALSSVKMIDFERAATASDTTYQRRYTLSMLSGLSVAACLLIVFATSILLTRDPANDMDVVYVKTANPSDEETQYSENKKLELPSQGSLTSQLRLAGLTPDIAPSNQQLSAVDTEALRQREMHLRNTIELLDNYETYSAMPESQLIGSSGHIYEASSDIYLSSNFKTSLASFR
jgi:hypothetical protein